jgi:hypothetical protein
VRQAADPGGKTATLAYGASGFVPKHRTSNFIPGFRFLLAVACSLFIAGQLSGNQQAGPPDTVVEAMKLLDQGKDLAALGLLEALEEKDSGTAQMEATIRSFVGDEAGVRKLMEPVLEQADKAEGGPGGYLPDGAEPADAVNAIVEQARNHQVVIVNEAHHVPRHRAFIAELARRLRDEGFSYYAAEGFGPATAELAERGYPDLTTGFYIREPVFGELVREVLELGYKPVGRERRPGYADKRTGGRAGSKSGGTDLQHGSGRESADTCRLQPCPRGAAKNWRQGTALDGDATGARHRY